MTERVPKVSVVIAAYRPGDAVRRVIDSLDAQTMPQDDFEVLFVDDGSGDGTYEQLQGFGATRPNIRVFTIPNSGWPSRPRNVGISHARGEYLLFMDHDDSLFPDGLRSAYEYASANDADVLSPKESKTNDVWWGMSSLTAGNIPNALEEEGIHRMLPMVPHKLYRRQMFLDHDIRFPEGARVLWEDWFINLDAFRWSKVVSVLADSPMYLWHASDTNSSHTFSPARVDFWDRLEDMMSYIASVLAGPQFHDARVEMMAHQVRTRVVDRCVRLAANPDAEPEIQRMALARARKLIARFTSDEVYAQLPRKHQGQLYLIRAGRLDLMRAFHYSDLALTARVVVDSLNWSDGALAYRATARWEPKEPDVPGFRHVDGRTLRVVNEDLERAIPPEILDFSDAPESLAVDLSVRSRAEHVTWAVPFTAQAARFADDAKGLVSLIQEGTGTIDFDAAALGKPLEDTVWDVRMQTDVHGMARKGALTYRGRTLPALFGDRSAVAYSSASKGLSIDLAGRLRTLTIDADPQQGPAGQVHAFTVPLRNINAFSQSTIEANTLVAVATDAEIEDPDRSDTERAELLMKAAANGALRTRVVAEDGVARLEGSASLAPGSYTLYARRGGTLYRTKRMISVDAAGQLSFD